MQLNKANPILEKLKACDAEHFPEKLQCWIKQEEYYNIYIFSIQLENEEELLKIKDDLRDYLAIFFQSQILEKVVERWNIYQVYFIEKSISLEVKLEIEQDKFATRKLVLDNRNEKLSDEDIESIIYSEIFAFSVQEKKIVKGSLLDELNEEDHKILSAIEQNNGNINNLLIQLRDEQN